MPQLASLAAALAMGVGCASLPSMNVLGPAVAWAMWLSALLVSILLAHAHRRRADTRIFRLALCVAFLCAGGLFRVHEITTAGWSLDPRDGAPDDRVLDTVEGVISGPIERLDDQRIRFNLHLDAPARARVRVSAPISPDEPLPGDRLAVTGYLRSPRGYRVPGRVPVERILNQRGADLTMSARTVRLLETDTQPTVWRWTARAHLAFSETIRQRGGSAAGNAVVRAMVTGDRSGLDRHLRERYRDAGVAHVLAVSGLHLAVVALLLFAGARRLFAAVPAIAMRVRPDLLAALIALPAAVFYTLATGARPSTLRALVVVTAVLLGAAMRRRARLLDALGLAALVLLAHRPSTLFDPGFQLSFAATVTLVLAVRSRETHETSRTSPAPGLARRLVRRLVRRLARLLRDLARASLWATLATAPLTAHSFGTVAYAGVFSNLLAVPLTELVLVPLGLMGVLVHQIWSWPGSVLLDLAIACAAHLDRVLALVASYAPAHKVFPPTGWELASAFLVWAGALARVRRAWPSRTCHLFIVTGLAYLLGSYLHSVHTAPASRDELTITFLDVGQGDAAVLQLPGGRVWMIDGGGLPFVSPRVSEPRDRQHLAEMPGRLSVTRFLAAQRIERIHRLIISHPHPDHYQGVRAVARDIPIDELWVARDHGDTAPSYRALISQLERAGTRIVHPALDQPHVRDGISLTALAPRYLDERATHDPVMAHNDNSLVVHVRAFGRVVLFTGDMEREAEELLIQRYGRALRADVLKVPHHGSPTSSTPSFVAATSPALAVISCGLGNRFGLPAPHVVTRWRDAGTHVLRTDRAGAITVTIAPDGTLEYQTHDP